MCKNVFLFVLLVLALSMTIIGCQSPATSPDTADKNPPKSDSTVTDTPAPEIRYTITEEEWNAWTTYKNYTIQYVSDEYNFVHKYTNDALEFDDGTIILYIGDRQYELKEKDDGYVARDCTWLQYSNDGLLADGYVYDEFVYDEEIGAYVLDAFDESRERWEVKFENGIPVSVIYEKFNDDGEATVETSLHLYKEVGTTVINIPEYVFEEK